SHCLTKNPRSSLKERTTENRTGFLGFLDTELRQNLNRALGEFIRINFSGFRVCWVSLVQQREKRERCGVLLPVAAAETEQRPAYWEAAHGEDRQPAQG